MTMPPLRWLALVCFLLLPLLPAAAQPEEVVDEIVAVVGDRILLRSDVDGYLLGLMQQQRVPYSEGLWMDALNQLIDQQAVIVAAKRDTTIKITDEQVEQALDQRISQLRAQVGSEARLEELYGKSILQIKAELRADFKDRLAAEELQGRRMRQIQITPSEVRAWFERIPTDSLPTLPEVVRVSHIVRYPAISEAARREAREIIEAVRDSIVAGGASFEDMARRFSDDPGSAADGGRYAGGKLSDYVPGFAAVAARTPVGEVSQVFETEYGLHIMRVNSRRGEEVDLNHILIQFDASASDPAASIRLLETLRDSLVAGQASFEALARRHSEEASSAQQGGRLVDPRTGERDLILAALGPAWQATLDTLDVGEISHPGPVELQDGRTAYHIVRLERRTPEHVVNLEDDYERIEQLALQEKRYTELRRWFDQLRARVYIDTRGKAARLSMAQQQ